MSIGQGPGRLSIYYGFPSGLYDPEAFERFMKNDRVSWMNMNEIPAEMNIEKIGKVTMYHLPQAGIGIEYRQFDENRCGIQMFYGHSKRDTADGIFRLILRKERQDTN